MTLDVKVVANHEGSAWLRGILGTLQRRIAAGTLRPCNHLTNAREWAGIPLWSPDLICCQECWRDRLPDSGPCSRCDSPLSSSVAFVKYETERTFVGLALCDECAGREVGR